MMFYNFSIIVWIKLIFHTSAEYLGINFQECTNFTNILLDVRVTISFAPFCWAETLTSLISDITNKFGRILELIGLMGIIG